MFGIGFVFAALGLFLADCAVQGRSPLETLKMIINDPANISANLAMSKGSLALTTDPGTSGSVAASADAGTGASVAYTNTVPNATAGTIHGGLIDHHPLTSDAVLAYARAQIGKPYKWGATGPDAFDCSGLVMKAYQAAGISLPRTTQLMVLRGTPVRKADLQPGDLVFPDLGHVQIYSGMNHVIEAPHTGLKVREVPIWGFWTARRIIH